MSIDLALWYEGAPVSHREAAAKYALLQRNEDAGLDEHPSLSVVYTELVARYPVADVGHGPKVWSAEPKIKANALRLSIVLSAIAQVECFVHELAEREGLVCFDPQERHLRLPSGMRLLQMSGGAVDASVEPDVERVAQAVVQTASARSHLILEKGTERYVQMSPALHNQFGVEYRDGGPDHHFRYETGDLSEVKDIFDRYARGDNSWRDRYSWAPFEL